MRPAEGDWEAVQMVVAVKIAAWSSVSFPLWLLLSVVLRDLGLPLRNVFAAALAWVGAGLLLGWALPLFGQHLGLPWAFAYP
jgi:hypothetical protein